MRIVAVINQKGGVGKTTTAVNLGAALALRGRKVLLVDLDPQGNLTDHLGLAADEPEKDERPSSYGVLMGDVPLAAAVLATATKGLWVLPSTPDLAGVEIELAEAPGREARLKQALGALPAGAYDWVLVDCPPSLGLLSLNAMVAAREVFITLQTEYLSLKGLGQVTRTVDMVREMVNPELVISGIVATLVDPVTNLAREVIEDVRVTYGQRVFETRIRKNVRLAEAPSHGLHIFDYQPDSPGAADYKALAEEVEAWDPVAGRKAQEAAKASAAAVPAKTPAAAVPAKAPAAAAPAKAPAPATAPKPALPAKPATPAAPAAARKPAAAPPSAPAAPARPAEAPRAPGGRFAPRAGTTPAPAAAPAAKAPAKPASTPAPARPAAAAPAPKGVPPKASAPAPAAAPTRAAAPAARPAAPSKASAPAPARPAPPPAAPKATPAPAPKTPAAPAAAKAPPAPAPKAPPAAVRPPAPPARPAVPSPGLRHERPWMKPPAK